MEPKSPVVIGLEKLERVYGGPDVGQPQYLPLPCLRTPEGRVMSDAIDGGGAMTVLGQRPLGPGGSWPETTEGYAAVAVFTLALGMGEELLGTTSLLHAAAIETETLRRPTGPNVYVLYWPGVVEIPWPEGVTVQEAVDRWVAPPPVRIGAKRTHAV